MSGAPDGTGASLKLLLDEARPPNGAPRLCSVCNLVYFNFIVRLNNSIYSYVSGLQNVLPFEVQCLP